MEETYRFNLTQYYDLQNNPIKKASEIYDTIGLKIVKTPFSKPSYFCQIVAIQNDRLDKYEKETTDINEVFDFFGNGILANTLYDAAKLDIKGYLKSLKENSLDK